MDSLTLFDEELRERGGHSQTGAKGGVKGREVHLEGAGKVPESDPRALPLWQGVRRAHRKELGGGEGGGGRKE